MIEAAVRAIQRGEVIGLPTDTVYGVAADPFNREALESLFAVKGRPGVKPIPILAASIGDLDQVVIIDDAIRAAATDHWPGGLTIVARRSPGAPDWIGSPERGTVGVRVPDHPVALELLAATGPLGVTSANRSGGPPASDAEDAEESLGPVVAVYLPGAAGGGTPSTVVDLSVDEPRIIRAGAIPWEYGR